VKEIDRLDPEAKYNRSDGEVEAIAWNFDLNHGDASSGGLCIKS
jgi:hypothetical protein